MLAEEFVLGLHQIHHFEQLEHLLLALVGLLIEVEHHVLIGLLGEPPLHLQEVHKVRVRAHAQKNIAHLFFDSLMWKVDQVAEYLQLIFGVGVWDEFQYLLDQLEALLGQLGVHIFVGILHCRHAHSEDVQLVLLNKLTNYLMQGCLSTLDLYQLVD